MSKRVAIIQNRFQKGGRMQVIISIIEALNNRGIIPDLITFKSNISSEEISSSYNIKVKFNVKEIFLNLKMPFEWNILFFNWISQFYLHKYDLVINSNNTSYLLSKKLPLISYVHFPRKKRNISSKKDIHFPEGENKSFWDYKSDLLQLARFAYRFDKKISTNNLHIANSEFTRTTLAQIYPISDSDIFLIYPPITPSEYFDTDKKLIVSSLGRFSPDKRQLEQIKIAQKVPHLKFKIYGFVSSETYFNSLKSYIKLHSIENVQLFPDATYNELKQGLSESSFFIHSLRNEPFGITTVQALQFGCIPIVHNSGGQVEIVPNTELRYNNKEEAISIFNRLSSTDKEILDNLRYSFLVSSKKYSIEIFLQQFNDILNLKL